MSGTTLASMREIGIKKVFSTPTSKIQDEVIAVFSSLEVRDAVKRAAKELAGDREAGIRLEVPRSLQGSLKALEAISFALKKTNPSLRRNVKFYDCLLYTSPSPRD